MQDLDLRSETVEQWAVAYSFVLKILFSFPVLFQHFWRKFEFRIICLLEALEDVVVDVIE